MPADAADTRERLLQAAAQEFAERGYAGATISRICGRAGANSAAVNYHFGGKEQLYRALAERGRDLIERHSPIPAGADGDDPAAALAAFIRGLVGRSVAAGGPTAWLMRLWRRELDQPGPMLDLLVELVVKPQHRRLRGILARLADRSADDPLVHRLATSVIGQCMIWLAGRAVLERLGQHPPADPVAVDALARHIAAFSLGGIRALAAEAAP